MIYEYTTNAPMCGIRNRKRIREYDPAVEFTGHSYHPIWNVPERRFLIINFENTHQQLLFEIEFGSARLTQLAVIPEMVKGVPNG